MTATSPPRHTNRLIEATSPYLLQHAHNPVEWFEWGPAALAKARAENKPIFLSIGYSACHWCHVMAHESFENDAVAALMNRYFVNIKVDREERPDLDEIYMRATLILNRGQGGWPMSVWLTPDLKPFFAGTYFPPDSKWGRPGFKDLCEKIGETWAQNPDAVRESAEQLTAAVRDSLTTPAGEATFTLDTIDGAVSALARAFDHQRGGISGGGTNKFPPSMALDLFLRAQRRYGADDARSRELLSLVRRTLDEMAKGGIYDQLGGGIARYSTDVEWHVPHFEKMLYDQALVSRAYVDAWQVTRDPEYRRVATEIFDYVLDDLRSPEGGFYSSRDADSEGVEGKFYVWTQDEIVGALDAENAELFCAYYDVRPSGNWSDPHAPGEPKNVLRIVRSLDDLARKKGLSVDDLSKRLAAARTKLLEIRRKRVPPGRDEKILVEWNGLMIAALARGGAVFGEQKYVQAAASAADFLLQHQYRNGRLMRAYRAGRTLESAFLSDYACLIEGLLELYEATSEPRWLAAARDLNDVVLRHYYDGANGGFFFTSNDHETLIARAKDVSDSATPSGNSVQLMNMLRLATMLGDGALRAQAEQTMDCFAAGVVQIPLASERFLAGVEFALAGPVELAVVGDPRAAATQALLRSAEEAYLPNRVIMFLNPEDAVSAPSSPLLNDRTLADGKPAVYICRNYACQRPVTTPAELTQRLAE